MDDKQVKVTGLFKDEHQAAGTITAVKDSAWKLIDVHGPIPSEVISNALKLRPSMVGWFALAGGIIGFLCGYFLAVFTATRWDLIVGGKPIMAYVPFFIVGFEFTILFAVMGNILGLILLMKLPAYRDLADYSPDCSGEHFGVVVGCDIRDEAEVKTLLADRGAEIRT